MSINYAAKSTEIIAKLKSEGYSDKMIVEHRRCFGELWKCLSLKDTPFSMDLALGWLERRKPSWSYDTFKRYRRALYRFEKYLRCERIDEDPHCGNNYFAYRDTDVSYIKLPDNYKALYREFYEIMLGERAKDTVNHYAVGSTDFLLFLSDQGCATPDKMTIELPILYLHRILNHKIARTYETKKKYAEGVSQLLSHLSERGCIPKCYAHVMSKLGDETVVTSLKLIDQCGTVKAFQPSKALEQCADSFLLGLDHLRYSVPPKRMFGFIFKSFFLFLEINHIAYSAEAIRTWLNHIPKNKSWELKSQIITWFADFVETGSVERTSKYMRKTLLIDTLPEWSRKVTEDYLMLRKKEGWEHSTITMCRSSCVRFFRFIDSKGVTAPADITPALVKEFHDTDPHSTPEATNAYSVRVRRLLKYMAEEKLVPQNLFLAISTQCAPKCEIVTIMSEEMIEAVYRYRESATSPMELRNTAIVMLGMRMGIRSSDIVRLNINDFNFKNRKVTFVQKKTNKVVTLPIPTDVGNSVYKYITQGRPHSGISGVDFIFVRHNSPYSNLNSSSNCNIALTHILSTNGLKLPPGQGFHITRRTFATRLLTARTKIDSIVDSLGHTSRQSIDDYLAHDEEGMRLCPMPFTVGGAL